MEALILLEGGPLSGEVFVAQFMTWPPPSRLLGREFRAYLAGTYELQEATVNSPQPRARYKLREDDDYHRLVRNQRARLHTTIWGSSE